MFSLTFRFTWPRGYKVFFHAQLRLYSKLNFDKNKILTHTCFMRSEKAKNGLFIYLLFFGFGI